MNAPAEAITVGRPKASKPEGEADARKFGTLVRLADDVAQVARELAPMVGKSMAELLSDTLRPILSKMREDEMRKRLGRK